MAYRTDGTANFNFFINRQGPRGPQGIQGPEGFSPNVQVEEDQGNTFTLRVTNKDNFFITSNLREHKEDRGGDYIRYDRAGQLMYIGDPNFATTVKAGEVRLSTADDLTAGSDTVALTPKVYKDDITSRIEEVNQNINALDKANVKLIGNQSIAGTKTFTDGIVTDRVSLSNGNSVLRPDAGRIKIGSTSNTAGTKLEGPYVEVRGTNVDIYGKFTARGFADFDYNTTFYQDAIIKGSAKDDNNNLYLKQNTITAGDNVQIVNTADGIKISSTAQGDVTLAGDNSFTGNNTFNGETTFNTHTWTAEQEAANLNVTSLATMKNVNVSGTLTSSGEINAVSIKAAGVKNNQNNKYYLTQGSITAGDNVTIEETTDGVKISSTGGGSSEPPANMVTTDTEQFILGTKTFNSGQTLFQRGFILGRLESIRTSDRISRRLLTYSDYTFEVGIDDRTTKILGTQVVNSSNKKFLAQGSVTAGDNISIEETTDGIKISSTGGGGPIALPIATMTTLGGVIIGDGLNVSENGTLSAQVTNTQYGQLLESIADLSTKIDNLTTRLNNLEEVIDGGVASSIYAPEPQKLQEQVVEGLSINEKINSVSEDVQVNDNGGT